MSDRVDKTKMARGTEKQARENKNVSNDRVEQYSTILGAIPAKPHFKRNYCAISSVHLNKKSSNFIKSMLMLARLSEKVISEVAPKIHKKAIDTISESVPEKFRLTKMFTSSISNFNVAAKYHIDRANLKGCVNVIITKRKFSTGGNLVVPEFGACFDCIDNSMIVYPAWKSIHGVTPIVKKNENGYRNSLIFYSLRGLKL